MKMWIKCENGKLINIDNYDLIEISVSDLGNDDLPTSYSVIAIKNEHQTLSNEYLTLASFKTKEEADRYLNNLAINI